jgi:hypothetical protein
VRPQARCLGSQVKEGEGLCGSGGGRRSPGFPPSDPKSCGLSATVLGRSATGAMSPIPDAAWTAPARPLLFPRQASLPVKFLTQVSQLIRRTSLFPRLFLPERENGLPPSLNRRLSRGNAPPGSIRSPGDLGDRCPSRRMQPLSRKIQDYLKKIKIFLSSS